MPLCETPPPSSWGCWWLRAGLGDLDFDFHQLGRDLSLPSKLPACLVPKILSPSPRIVLPVEKKNHKTQHWGFQ